MIKEKEIQLPNPITIGKLSLEEAISKRRSQRSFLQQGLVLEEIGQLLWAAQGMTSGRRGFVFRAAPSAGALYPIEIYLVSKDGLFHYLSDGHKLKFLGKEDLRGELCASALGQESVSLSPIDIIICAVYSRVVEKYGQRGVRYTHIEAGHVAQNIHLQAVALGLGSVSLGAFNDEEVQKILNLPKDHAPLYIIPVGA